ncbi:MAG: HAMP domain-containing sensor histidine kinase [Acidobacteriota bacterium]
MERGNEKEREKVKRRSRFFLILIVSSIIIIGTIISLNRINKSRINSEFKNLTSAGGKTISDLIGISGFYLSEMGEKTLRNFLDELYDNKSILYIGLINGDELIYLLSRFEGYFPVVSLKEETRFISSPIGTVFEVKGTFGNKEKGEYSLIIGFDYQFLGTFEQSSGKFFLFILGVILAIIIVVVLVVLRYDKILYKKDLEYHREREEKERLAELSMLTSEIAHEIKNPLNSIYLSFNALDNYLDSSEEAVFYSDAVKGEIRRISDIINSYSGLSKSVETNFTEIGLTKLIEELKILKIPEMVQKGVEFTAESRVDKFITDRDLLVQILLNLIDNAVEAGADQISIYFTQKKNDLILNVLDNGDEIHPDRIDKIFKPYESSKSRGMGLGLHIVLKNVKALGGDIKVVSGESGNKNFEIILKEGVKR